MLTPKQELLIYHFLLLHTLTLHHNTALGLYSLRGGPFDFEGGGRFVWKKQHSS